MGDSPELVCTNMSKYGPWNIVSTLSFKDYYANLSSVIKGFISVLNKYLEKS